MAAQRAIVVAGGLLLALPGAASGASAPWTSSPAPSALLSAPFPSEATAAPALRPRTHLLDAPAVAARRRSATAFAAQSDGAALATLREKLPSLFDTAPWQPIERLAPGTSVVSYDAEQRSAIVRSRGGLRTVLSSTGPLRVEDRETGLLAPVDTSLEAAGGGFAPVNSPTPVQLPVRLSDPIQVGRFGIRVSDAAITPGEQVGDTVVWANALADTDVVAQPTVDGAELSLTLRSAASPETFPLDLHLPAGTRVRLADATPGAGAGLELVDGAGKLQGSVTAPVAWDADHVTVPTRWTLVNGSPVLQVDHAGRDIAWPIAVDPTVLDQRYGYDLATRPWAYIAATGTPVNEFYGYGGDDWGWGMYQRLTTPFSYSQSLASWWELSLAGRPTAGILQVAAQGLNHDTGANAAGGPETCTFLGLWTDDYTEPYPGPTWCDTYRNRAANAGIDTNPLDASNSGNKARIGIYTNGPGIRGYFQQSVGTLVARFADNTLPSSTLSGTNMTWNGVSTVSASASDSGLGIKSIAISADRAGLSAPPFAGSCPTDALCAPSLATSAVSVTGLPDGVTQLHAWATDPAGNPDDDPKTIRFDRAGPDIAFSGSLWTGRATPLDAGTFSLTAKATDGDASSPATTRSGVAQMTITVDGAAYDTSPTQACPADNCSLTRTVSGEAGLLGPGTHTIKATAKDQLNNVSTAQFTVTVDCCFAGATQWNATATAGELRYADVNGDNFDDAVIRSTAGAVTVELSNGAAFANPVSWGTWPTTRDFNVYDLNGDGLADLVGRDSAGVVSRASSTGTTFAAPATVATLASSYATMRLGDVDNDGLGDIVGENPSSGAIQIILTDGVGELTRFDGGTWTPGYTFILADVDGDGTDDAVGRDVAAGTVKVGYSTGGDFAVRNGPWTIPANADFAMADVNRDGLADLLYRESGSDLVRVRPALQSADDPTFDTAKVWARWGQTRTLTASDVTGDGSADLVSRDTQNSAMYVAISHGRTPDGVTNDADTPPEPLAQAPAPSQSLAALPAQCQNANATKIAMMDDGRMLYHQNEAPSEQPGQPNEGLGVQHTVQRMATLGAQVVRLTVYWGAIENKASVGGYNFDRLDAAVDAITSAYVGNDPACGHLEAYLTLTGEAIQKLKICNPAFNANARDCESSITGLNPVTATYKAFVKATVQHFEARASKPSTYAIWNEPNLSQFLAVTGTTSTGRSRAVLSASKYRDLYINGYQGVQEGWCAVHAPTTPTCANSAHLPVFIGELSEQVNHRPIGANDKPRAAGYSALDYLYETVQPRTATSPEIKADGLAIHAYQHIGAPRFYGPTGEVGIGKLLYPHVYDRGGTGPNRVGVAQALMDLRDKTGTSGTSTTTGAPHWLRTPGGLKAPLYITEFGYFSLPPNAVAANANRTVKARSKWYTEATRTLYWTSSKGAIYQAKRAGAQWLTIHTLSESGSNIDPVTHVARPKINGHDDYRAAFDTGLISPYWASDWSDVTSPAPANPATWRQYGKDTSPYADAKQPRTTYCGLYKELKSEHFPTQQSGVPCP